MFPKRLKSKSMARDPLHSICPCGVQGCYTDGSPSLQLQALSLEHTLVRPVSPLPHCSFLPLPSLGGTVKPLQPVMRGAQSTGLPVSRVACALGAGKLAQPECLCNVLSAREWEQSRTCAEWHGAAVFCLSLLLARCVSCTSLFQTVEQGKARTTGGAWCPVGLSLVGHPSCVWDSVSVGWLLTG